MGEPARQWSWAPFAPGNTLSLRSGVDSPRTVTSLADDLAAQVVELFPQLAAYPYAVSDWAHPTARAALLRRAIDDLVDAGGSLADRTDLLKEVRADERRAAEAARSLGLDPTSHVKLVRERAEAGLSVAELEERRSAALERGAAGWAAAEDRARAELAPAGVVVDAEVVA